jgi:hypothetical protein
VPAQVVEAASRHAEIVPGTKGQQTPRFERASAEGVREALLCLRNARLGSIGSLTRFP